MLLCRSKLVGAIAEKLPDRLAVALRGFRPGSCLAGYGYSASPEEAIVAHEPGLMPWLATILPCHRESGRAVSDSSVWIMDLREWGLQEVSINVNSLLVVEKSRPNELKRSIKLPVKALPSK